MKKIVGLLLFSVSIMAGDLSLLCSMDDPSLFEGPNGQKAISKVSVREGSASIYLVRKNIPGMKYHYQIHVDQMDIQEKQRNHYTIAVKAESAGSQSNWKIHSVQTTEPFRAVPVAKGLFCRIVLD